MSTLFDLSRPDLEALALFLRPALETIRLERTSVERLRALVTEWLLLNDLSTMHRFERAADGHWLRPSKADCQSCGKYRVGRPEVYKELSVPYIEQDQILRPDREVSYHEYAAQAEPCTSGVHYSDGQRQQAGLGDGDVIRTQPMPQQYAQLKAVNGQWHAPRRHKPSWSGHCCCCCEPMDSPPPRRRVPVTNERPQYPPDDRSAHNCVDVCVMCVLCQCCK